jgi:hypothetical protein
MGTIMKNQQEIIDNLIEIEIQNDDQFLILRESLTRIGVANTATKTLFQSSHVLHKRGKYYLVHFKQMFLLDGKSANIEASDYGRLKKILSMITEWGLTKAVRVPDFYDTLEPVPCYVIASQQKQTWELRPKYRIGTRI